MKQIFGAMALMMAFGSLPAQAQPGGGEGNMGAAIVNGMCAGCHALDPAAAGKQGPLLKGVFGRKAGTVAGYDYSPGLVGLKDKGVVWNEETLKAFLSDPAAYAPGTKKLIALKNPERLAEIIAYLKQTQSAAP